MAQDENGGSIPIDRQTLRTTFGVGQTASGFLKKGGGIVGAGLAMGEGVIDSLDSADLLQDLARSLGTNISKLGMVSATANRYLKSQDDKPVTKTAKFGVSTLTVSAGSAIAGAIVGSIVPIIGTFIGMGVGLAGGMATGYLTGKATDDAVDAVAGTDIAAVNSIEMAANLPADTPPAASDVFAIVQPQLPAGVQTAAAEAMDMAAGNAAGVICQYGDHDVFRRKAEILCGDDYDPCGLACEQIAAALAARKLPPALLLVDNKHLEDMLDHLEESRPLQTQGNLGRPMDQGVESLAHDLKKKGVIPADNSDPMQMLPRNRRNEHSIQNS